MLCYVDRLYYSFVRVFCGFAIVFVCFCDVVINMLAWMIVHDGHGRLRGRLGGASRGCPFGSKQTVGGRVLSRVQLGLVIEGNPYLHWW